MWNHIETYIRDHREELDHKVPSPELWAKIAQDLESAPKGKVRSVNWQWNQIFRVAAAVLMIIAGAWIWFRVAPQSTQPMSSLLPAIHQIQDAGPEWHEAEQAYRVQLEALVAQVDQDLERMPLYQRLLPRLTEVNQRLQEIRKAHSFEINQDSLLQELRIHQAIHVALMEELIEGL